MQANDRAACYPSADRGPALSRFHVQLHKTPRQQPVVRFNERTARRNIDEARTMTWSNERRDNSVILDAMSTPVAALARSVQSGVHLRVRDSNLRTRVFPVSPNMRMAYCEVPFPRM